MKLQKWNYEKHEYDPYFIPDNWKVSTYEEDLDTVVNCCQCGRKMLVEDSWTSFEVHNSIGMGYMVCNECHEKEWRKRKQYKNE